MAISNDNTIDPTEQYSVVCKPQINLVGYSSVCALSHSQSVEHLYFCIGPNSSFIWTCFCMSQFKDTNNRWI